MQRKPEQGIDIPSVFLSPLAREYRYWFSHPKALRACRVCATNQRFIRRARGDAMQWRGDVNPAETQVAWHNIRRRRDPMSETTDRASPDGIETEIRGAAGNGNGRDAFVAAVASAICMGLSFAPVFMGTFPLFLEPVSRDFHWAAATFPQAMLIAGLVGALSGPLIGRQIDTVGVRKVLLPGLVLWAATLLAIPYIRGSVVVLYVVSAIMGLTTVACGPVAFMKVISGWFDRSRGLVLSTVLGGSVAVFTAFMLFLTRVLISNFGWQSAYMCLASLVGLIALPVAYLFLREATYSGGQAAAPDGPQRVKAQAKPGEAFTSRAFWTMILASIVVCACSSAVSSHFLPWGAEHGVTGSAAVLALSFYSLAGPVASLIAGAIADRLPSPKLLALVYAVPLLGFSLMQLPQGWAIIGGLALMGAGFSAVAGLLPYLTSRYFGLANASTIFAVAMGIVTLSLGVGPVLLGLVRDKAGSYGAASPAIGCILVFGAILSSTLPRYPDR